MIVTRIVILLILFISHVAQAEPWFTGPLFAEPGETVPRGHIESYIATSFMTSNTIYDRLWHKESTPTFTSTQISPQFMYGLTDKLDIQYTAFYTINQNEQIAYEHIGDTSIMLGFQAFTQDKYQPDLRITLEQIIPTGIYNNLPANNNGADVTGMGSNQTSLGFNFQYLSKLSETHYLNSYLSLSYSHAMDVNLKGISAYGGTSLTHGHIDPGDSVSLDLAAELSLTQQWVAVLEGVFIYQQASVFHGVVGERTRNDPQPFRAGRNIGSRAFAAHRLLPSRRNIGGEDIGSGNLDQITLAPAMEYNFSDHYGVIAGVWFTIAGKNTPAFISPMIMFTAYW